MTVDGRMIITSIAIVSLFLSSTKTIAQETDFSGVWVLNKRISLSGTDYANGVPKQLNVIQKSDSITIERLNVDGNEKDYTIIETMAFDNSPTIMNRSGNRKRISTVKWSNDNKKLIEAVAYYKPNSETETEFTFSELWSLADSAKELRIEKYQESANGEKWSMNGLYRVKATDPLTSGKTKEGGIHFEQTLSWDEVKVKAKKENKYIFVDAFATWCLPCKWMDENVYVSEKAGAFLNHKFISIKVQMDTTKYDNEQVKKWHPVARSMMEEYNIEGFPTYLFFSPEGKIVHKSIGQLSVDAFISLAKDAADPKKQYYTLLRDYRKGKKSHSTMSYLAVTAKSLGERYLTDSVALDYKMNYLERLTAKTFFVKEHLDMVYSFYALYNNSETSKGTLFHLFYRHGEIADSLVNYVGFASAYVNKVITREEIENKISNAGKRKAYKLDWGKMAATIKGKYGKIDADLLVLDAQIKYYRELNDRSNAIKFFVNKLDRYGPSILGEGADNEIVRVMLLHCEDRRLLDKAIGWIEQVINSDAYRYPIAMVYGNYGGLLYKAGRVKEGIESFEKHMDAIGYNNPENRQKYWRRYKPKVEVLERMKRGENIDSTWNATAFF